MTHCKTVLAALAFALIPVAIVSAGDEGEQPAIEGSENLVSVNGEPITLDDLRLQLDNIHWNMGSRGGDMVQKPDPWAILERLVDVNLMAQEARAIGIGELPEVSEKLQTMKLELLKQQLVQHRVRDLTAPDPEDVERLYRGAVREVKVESALFPSEDYARAFVVGVAAGGDFQTLARKMFDEEKALDVVSESPYFNKDELLPAVDEAVAEAEPGWVSEPIPVGESFAVVKLVEVRYPEDPEARQEAFDTALRVLQQTELLNYTDEMRERYAEIDRDLAESLDFEEGGPGLSVLKADTRVVAKIEGGQNITVGELAQRIEKKFYHGVEGAIERRRVNSEVMGALDQLILERAAQLEAQRLNIEETRNYLTARKDQENRLLFALLMQRVIRSEIEVDEQAVQAYYREHATEYMRPVVMHIESLAFENEADARTSLKLLSEGADLKWTRTNAIGLADPAELTFRGGLLSINSLPEAVRGLVEEASAGEVFFYPEEQGHYHVLLVAEIFPERQLELEEIREEIEKRAAGEAQQETVKSWMSELRDASEIEFLVDETELRGLLGLGSREDA